MISAGGVEPNPALLPQFIRPYRKLIAADGGLRLLKDMQLVPDLLVGDFDTLSHQEVENFRAMGGKIETYNRDKDSSDTELAILRAVKEGATRITILGALGGEWDHTVTNLLAPLWLCHQRGVWGRLLHSEASVFCLTSGTYRLKLPSNTRVSLAAVSELLSGISIEGMAFSLLNETIKREQSRGLANRTLQEKSTIRIGAGTGLLTISYPS